MLKIKDYSLYLAITQDCGLGRSSLEIAMQAIRGGVDIIQLREKGKSKDELLKLAKQLRNICQKKKIIFIVNDDPLLAKKSNADGVHLGQQDLCKFSLTKTRKLLGKEKIIGVSTHSLSQFKKANSDKNVDYIAYGPIFPTKTKNFHIGTKDVKQVLKIAKKPVVFIGGINTSNLDNLLEKGVKNIAMIRSILQAKNIAAKVKSFKRGLIREKKRRANEYKN